MPALLVYLREKRNSLQIPADLLLALPKRAKRPEGPSPLPSGAGRPLKSRGYFNHDVLNFCLHFAARYTTDCPLGPAQYENIRCMAEHCSSAGTGTETARGAYPLPAGCFGPLFPLGTAYPFLSAPSCSAIPSVHRHLASGSASLASGGTGKPAFPIYPNG